MTNRLMTMARQWRWPHYLLILSLGVNLIIGGLVLGAVLRGGPPEHIRAARDASALGLRPYMRALDDQSREALLKSVRDNRGDFHAGKATMTAHLDDLVNALTATPYVSQDVAGVLGLQASAISENVALGQRLLMVQIDAMTVEQRAALAAGLKSRSRRN